VLKSDSSSLRKYARQYPFPTDILIETTTRCNLRCPMCPRHKLDRPKQDMSFDLWKKIIDQIVDIDPNTVIWPSILGEPLLLGDDIFRYIGYAKEKGLRKICMNTNLAVFDSSLIEPLFSSGVDEVIIGLDSVISETYSRIRIGGDLNTVLKNIDTIVNEKARRGSNKPNITIQYVMQDENEAEETHFTEYWGKKNWGLTLKLRYRTSWGGLVEPTHRMVNQKREARDMPCLWLLRQLLIFCNGDVPQCHSMAEPYFGNVSSTPIIEIWNGCLGEIRERHLRKSFDFFPCNQCNDWQCGMSKTIET